MLTTTNQLPSSTPCFEQLDEYAHYKSPAFDSIMAETLKVTDEAQRTALYTKAEQQLDKDSAIVPVYYYVNARLVKPWVGGYTGKDPLDNTYTRNMYIVKH